MKIIQRPVLKFLAVFSLSLVTAFTSSAQTSQYRLTVADSLFQLKRYTQSLGHYEEILGQRQYTPAMLLKMAYVQEGLNHIGPAMYYLNLYFIATNDKSVLTKMDELATKYDLEGYETTDSNRFRTFVIDNHLLISLSLAALIVLMLSLTYYTRMKVHARPVGPAIAVAVLAIVLFIHQQYGTRQARGIIAEAATYVMDGPSAGAAVLDILDDGHRVNIIGKNDVWMKIEWDDQVAYVKQKSVRTVKL